VIEIYSPLHGQHIITYELLRYIMGGRTELNAFLLSRALLQFNKATIDDLHGNLSAAVVAPDGSLWLASDELQTIERLTQVSPCVFGEHHTFPMADYITLFDSDSEIDIEGMDYADGYLWFTGSHSLKRKKAKGKQKEKDIARIANVVSEPNRYLLGRIPLVGDTLFTDCSHPDHPEQHLTAAALQPSGVDNVLMDALRADEHVGPFLATPLADKENGFNIEGLAVCGDRLFLGLRGPVLDGWAIILEIEVQEKQPGVLTLKKTENASRPYKKHFLRLDGLGIRELQLHGDDLLILAGPSMRGEGAMKLFRWQDALNHTDDSLSHRDSADLDLLFVLPFVLGFDQAEGMACLPCLHQPDALLIVYDRPDPARMVGQDALWADIFRLPAK
jgi:Protein of unknown function (DUF3616)